jgi:leucine-rich repeat protein SHOC2
MIPNWFSYRGKGSSLSFHVPPVFQGLVVGVVWQGRSLQGKCKVIIKNKSNGIQLFKAKIVDCRSRSWLRYISISEMEMKEYSGDEELELRVDFCPFYLPRECIPVVFECGIHVIVEKTEAFEGSEWNHESEVGRDRVIPAPPW